MLEEIKKIGVVIVIAILFSMFSFSIVDVVMEKPKYSDFCDEIKVRVLDEEKLDTVEQRECSDRFEEVAKKHRFIGFIITSIMGVLAIIVGLYATSKKDVVDWVFAGLLIGGIITISIGTMAYFRDMGRFVKPFILLAEMALIILVAVKTSAKKKK